MAAWVILAGGVADAALRGDHSPVALLVFHGAVTALAAAGLWLHFKEDPLSDNEPARQPRRPRPDPQRYD